MDQASLKHFLTANPFRALKNADGTFNGMFVTCPVRLAFLNLEKPQKKDNGNEVYSLSALIPPAADIKIMREMVGMAAAAKWGDRWRELAANGHLKSPIKSQDANANGTNKSGKKYQGFEAGGFYFDAQRSVAADRPVLLDRNLQPVNPDAFYSGCWAILKIRPYEWETKTTQGVSFGIQTIQKLADDQRFASEGGDPTDGLVAHGDHGGATASPSPSANGAAKPANVGNASEFW